MRVFVLCTGRTGSTTFERACLHIDNFSAGHETQAKVIGSDRMDFPDDHIEVDNRLSFYLGSLDRKYGDQAFYVHLKRNRKKTAESFLKRIDERGSVINVFCAGVKLTPPEKLGRKERLELCYEYVDMVNSNIDHFLHDKTNKIVMDLENAEEGFRVFWRKIGARGNLNEALYQFSVEYNNSKVAQHSPISYELKLFFLRLWRQIAY